MRAIISSTYSDPSGYEHVELPEPTVLAPDDVIIEVHAASINPVDVKITSGVFRAALPESLPIRIGYDCAGIVTALGASVNSLLLGDKVWSRLPEASKGSYAEYMRCPAEYVARMPTSLSFADAASLPLAAMTAMQALRKYSGSLQGKTVFIPAGLSGTGAFACQLAKNVHKAGKVITTVSTAKVAKVTEYLGDGVVDQIIDYTKDDPMTVVPAGSVDFVLDTMGQAMELLSLMTPGTGTIVSISTTPSGTQLQDASFFKRPDKPRLPWYARAYLNGADYVRKLRARRWGVIYNYMFLQSTSSELDLLASYIDQELLRPVVGLKVNFGDITAVRDACMQVYRGKGGIGKTVIEVITDA